LHSEPTSWADLLFALSLFREAILTGVIAGAVLGYLGVFIVLRRMVFVAAGLTQAAGLGVVLAFYSAIHLGVEVHPVLGAILGALAAAVVLSIPPDRLRISSESVLAAVWLLGSAGAVLFGSRIRQEAHDVESILFGPAVLVRPEDFVLVLGVAGIALALGVWMRRGVVLAGFDPDGARVQGVPVRWLDFGLLAIVTLLVSVSTRALGALPVFAFSVGPAIAALLAAPSLRYAFPLAFFGGALAGGCGYLSAWWLDFPVGASQAAVALGLVVLAVPIRLLRSGG